jgi:hypothetical protein
MATALNQPASYSQPESVSAAATMTAAETLSAESEALTATPALEPTQEEIARLAYQLWEDGGCQDGTAESDWARAEAILRAQA